MDVATLGAARSPTLALTPARYPRRPCAIVSAKPRRRRNREPHAYEYGEEEEEDEAVGVVGPAALRSDPARSPNNPPPTPRPPSASDQKPGGLSVSGGDPGGGGPLRGSDVLQALQRAAAKKGKKRRPARRSERGEQPPAGDYENVRPIEIRSDWAQRIAELARRLQLLQARQHF